MHLNPFVPPYSKTLEHDSWKVIFLRSLEMKAKAKGNGWRRSREQGLPRGPASRSCYGGGRQEMGKEAGFGQGANLAPGYCMDHLGPAKTSIDCNLGLCNASHMGTAQPGQCSETGTSHSWNLYKLHFEVLEGAAHILQPESHSGEEAGSTHYQVPRVHTLTLSHFLLPPTCEVNSITRR